MDLILYSEWQAPSVAPLWVDAVDEIKDNMSKIEDNSINQLFYNNSEKIKESL